MRTEFKTTEGTRKQEGPCSWVRRQQRCQKVWAFYDSPTLAPGRRAIRSTHVCARPCRPVRAHVHMGVYTCRPTCALYEHTHRLAYVHVCAHMQTGVCTHACVHSQTCTNARTHPQAYTGTRA